MRVSGPDAGGAYDAAVEMGKVGFPRGAPFVRAGVAGQDGRVALSLPAPDGAGVELKVLPVSVGNPHAVLFGEAWTPDEVEHFGAMIATSDCFPRETNVQFAQAPVGRELRIRIWERGVGTTSSSGTSACAAVAASVRSGLMPFGPAVVRMEGGDMEVDLRPDWSIRLRGPVEEVCVGELTAGFAAGR